MALAAYIGRWSKDRSRQVGCVIVGPDYDVRAIGYNGFPRGVDDDVSDRHDRPNKYAWTEHAERNAIYNAARAGVSLRGCSMYLPWYPCIDCARAIVQSGIDRLFVAPPDEEDPRWGDHFAFARQLFDEVGLTVRFMKAKPSEDDLCDTGNQF